MVTITASAPVTTSAPSQALLLAGRNIRRLRTPATVFGAAVIPLVFFIGFSAVLGRLLDARGIDAAQYLTPAIVVQAGMFTAMSAGFALSADVADRVIVRFRSMSVGWAAVLAGRLGADAVRVLGSVVVVVLAGAVAGFRFTAGLLDTLGFVALAVAFTLCLSTGAAALGAGSDDPESVNAMLQIPYLPLIMLSSAFVPADAFPDRLEPVIRNSPVTLVVDALRGLADSGASRDALPGALAWIAGLAVLFVGLFHRSLGAAMVPK